MAEVAQVLYKAVAGDKIKPQKNPSAWAAQERQGTKRNVPELPDLAGDNVQKSRAKRTALKKKSYSPVRGPKTRQRRKQDECEVLVDHRPKSASSSFKKQKQILQIKITSPKQKQNVLAHKLPYSFSKTASTEMVDATPGSDQNIVQDAAVNQEGHQVNADQPIPETIRVPYLGTFPISGLNVNVEDAREDQNPQRANSDLPHPETGRAPGPNAAPKADRNIFQDVMNSQETKGVDAGLPVTKTGKSPYLDITPESDENARDIRVSHQEVKGAGSHEALSKTSRACYLDTTQQSDQNLVQDVGINLEPEETAGDQLLSKTKGVQTLDATPESAQNFTHVKSISQGLEGTNDHQLVPEATRVPFAKILANQPQVLLPKLSFNISIPLDCISLKKACERRGARERPSKTTTKVKEAQLTTSGQKKVAGTQSLQGFKRPSQLVPPVSDTLADELPSAAAHPQSSSSGGLQVSGQDSRSTLPLVNSERQAEPVRNDSVAEYLDCSGEIIEAPEVAHTVEVTSTEFPPPTTNCTCSEVGSGTQEGVVPCNDLYSQELERVPSESESVTCDRKSSQLYVGEDTLFDYELDNQVQIISSEYESMGPGSTDTTSEDCSELCLSSPPMKVVVTALTRPHSTDDVPLVSLTSAYRQSEARPEVALAYSHTLPPMQIFLSRMSESQQLAVPLQELASQLSADLLSPELVRLSDTTDGCSASEEVRSPCCPEAASSDSSGEAVTPTQQETSETEVHGEADGEAVVNQQHQENAQQQAVESCRELALTGDRTTEHSDVGGTAEESSPGETDSKQITDTTVPTVTSPVSHSVPCSVAGPTQPPPVLSSSPVLSALLATMAETSLCVTAPRDVPPVALVRGRNSPENRCENPNVPEGQKTVDSSEMSQNGVSNVCPSPAVLLTAPHLSSDEVSHTTPSHFSDDLSLSLPLPPLGADFGDFPEEDCISLVCDTESFLSDFGDELMESDRKMGETDKRRKPGSPFQRGNQPQGTSGTNNQLGKDGQPQSVLGTPRKHPPLQTVDWSEVAQYQPVSRSLAGGDCPTNDLRTRLIRRDNQSAPVPTAPGRSWTAPAHLQGSADSRPHPPLRNQAIPKGYCYDFVRNGRCLRRACPYIHDRPRPQSGTPQPQCPPSVRKVIIDPQRTPATEQHEDTQNILALVNECSMALNAHQRGGRHSHDQGSEERAEASSLESAGSLESDGSASPAAIFEAAYSFQQCTSWREARDTLLDLCRRRPEVAGCQPVVAELMAKLQGPGAGASPNDGPEVLGEKFGNFVAVFRRYLAENVSDPATNTLKQTLSCLGVSCALLCCNGQRWGQARRILDCLYHHRFPCQGELTQNVLLIQQLLAKHQQPNLQDGYAAPCVKRV
ncbi:uncharacterized protein LOC110983349 isoform X2 [Acanthaster planci]|uniref:Uncharacterized protein LOC110983349 isoform X2 n=1 Tax=Acanthaster planci TaxID=133434 RepID=A0A8B7YZV1_ACAPL|nr:uncharacterized protein LOC110983349 isoform X2 [Acanthaster planci]